MSFGETTLIPSRPFLKVPGLGLSTWVQAAPSQCRINVCQPLYPAVPTAHTSPGPATATPLRTPQSISGVGTMFHCVPSHRNASGLLPADPTAHTSLGDAAATPYRLLLRPGTLRLTAVLQVVPFQCIVKVCSGEPTVVLPTAHTSLGPATATPRK